MDRNAISTFVRLNYNVRLYEIPDKFKSWSDKIIHLDFLNITAIKL